MANIDYEKLARDQGDALIELNELRRELLSALVRAETQLAADGRGQEPIAIQARAVIEKADKAGRIGA